MKTFLLQNPKRILALASLAGICGLFGTASAQTHKVREYANYQLPEATALLASVDDAANAISGSLRDSSTLNLTAGVLGITNSTQYLGFSTDGTRDNLKTISAGDTIYIKFSSNADLIALLGNVEIGTFTMTKNGLGFWTNNRTSTFTTATLLSALNGAGTNELAIIAPAACNGVYLRLSAVVGLLSSANLFHAYILKDAAGDAGCPTNIDWLSGTSAAIGLDLASATSSIQNPQSAFDNDLNTSALLSTGVDLLSISYLTDILNTPGKAGDSVRIIFDNPSGGLLNLDLLSGFEIQAYNGNTAVGDPVAINSSLINLALLPGATNKSVITAPIIGTNAGDFDRIKLTYGGVAQTSSVLGNGTMAIYDMSVLVPAPQTGGVANSDQYAYVGNNVTLAATANANGDPIGWYSNPNGSGAVTSPISGLTAGTHTYYARSLRDGCASASANDTLNVHVVTPTNPGLPNGNVNEPYSQLVTIDAPTSGLPNPSVYKFTYVSSTNPSGTIVQANTFGTIGSRIALSTIPTVYTSGPSNLSQAAFTSIDLGDGLSYNDVTNTIEGTPTTEGNYTVTFSVVDDGNGSIPVGNITKTIAIGAALPVNLTNFDINLDANKNVVLTWTTESEQGSIRFDVLRSNNGTDFTTIGTKEAAGISTTTRNYSFIDNNPGAKSYYKLNIVKTDGVKASKTVSIVGGRVAGFSINPNPATNDITITGISASDIKSVSIYDAGGRLVQKATNSHINVQNLSQGIYFVTVVTKDGNKTNGKFLKK